MKTRINIAILIIIINLCSIILLLLSINIATAKTVKGQSWRDRDKTTAAIIDLYYTDLPVNCYLKLFKKLAFMRQKKRHKYMLSQVDKGLFCLDLEIQYIHGDTCCRGVGSYNSPSWRN